MVVILLTLGSWQVRRLHWKEDLIAHAERYKDSAPEALPSYEEGDERWRSADFHRVDLSGRFVVGKAFGFQVSTRGELMGGDLVVPMLLDDGRVVLVDMGWLADPDLPPKSARGFVPAGQVALDGVARYVGDIRPNFLTPKPDLARPRWYDWHIPAMSDVLTMPLLPIVVELDQRSTITVDGKPMGRANRPQPKEVVVDYRNDHLGYAMTWYGLAGALVVIYVIMGFKRGTS